MPRPIPVILAEYDPIWPLIAANHTERLLSLGPTIVVVHHIGSTAVPGLAAKPIIDLMPLVTNLADLDRLRFPLESLGYHWHGEFGITGRRFCTFSNEAGTRIAHLHFFEPSSLHVRRHIAFRDYLRANSDAAHEYESEKRRARDLHPKDSHAYTDEKAAWIQDAQAKALLWLSSQR